MTSLTLSVVIPAYNAASDIDRTIDALVAALEGAPSFVPEIVLVDDGSTDDTATAAARASGDRVLIRVVTQANQGRFLARQTGLAAATGEWALLLDTRVRLEPGSLAFVAKRLVVGERVWNGHVLVETEGNPIGAFWKAVAYVAWKDYLAAPTATSFGLENFDHYPKGTGCFLAPRALLIEAIDSFSSRYPDLRFVSDDTAVIRSIAGTERVHLSPDFDCRYEARSTLASFFKQAVYRGTTFVDGHLRPESRFFAGAVAFFPVSAVLFLLALRRPIVTPVIVGGGALAGGAVAAIGGCSPYEVRSVAALAPVYAVGHGLGMWRGLALLLRSRLRRSRGGQ